MARHIYQGTATDGNGRVISTATITPYLAGTTTAVDVYAAASGGSAVNSVASDSYGAFEFYVDDTEYTPSHKFKIVISKTSYTSTTWDNIEIIPEEAYRYYVDPTATDQGASTSRGSRSTKDFVDDIGTSKSATLVFSHNGGANTTPYTFSTTESIPSNITVKIEPGAILQDDASNASLTINGVLEAGSYNIFNFTTGTGQVNLYGSTNINLIWFCDGGAGTAASPYTSGSGTAGLTDAWESVKNKTGGVFAGGAAAKFRAPSAFYSLTASAAVKVAEAQIYTRNFILEGDGVGSTVFTTAADIDALALSALDSAQDTAFYSVVLKGFSVVSTGASTKAGISFSGTAGTAFSGYDNAHIENVLCTGFYYGLYIFTSWTGTFDGLCNFSGNSIGIYARAVNATAFHDITVRACSLAGIVLHECTGISVDNILAEQCPVGLYIYYSAHVDVGVMYYEFSGTATENNIEGTDVLSYTVYVGKDPIVAGSDDSSYITIRGLMYNSAEGNIYLSNVDGVSIDIPGIYFVAVGADVQNLVSRSSHQLDVNSRFVEQTVGKSSAFGINTLTNYNLVPNGNFNYPGLPLYSDSGPTATYAVSTQNIASGEDSKVLDITLPDDEVNKVYTLKIPIKLQEEFGNSNVSLMYGVHFKASTSDVAQVRLILYDNTETTFMGRKTYTGDFTGWKVINNAVDINTNNDPESQVSFGLEVTRTTGTGAINFYIDEIRVVPSLAPQMISNSPYDMMTGLSGQATCTTADNALFKSSSIASGFNSGGYRVLHSPVFVDNTAAPHSAVEYSGANFILYADIDDTLVDYLIVPLMVTLP